MSGTGRQHPRAWRTAEPLGVRHVTRRGARTCDEYWYIERVEGVNVADGQPAGGLLYCLACELADIGNGQRSMSDHDGFCYFDDELEFDEVGVDSALAATIW